MHLSIIIQISGIYNLEKVKNAVTFIVGQWKNSGMIDGIPFGNCTENLTTGYVHCVPLTCLLDNHFYL